MASIIQQPSALSLSGNLAKFIISSGSSVSFLLRDGNETLLDASYEPNKANRITIDVRELVEKRLFYRISHENFYQQNELVKNFTVRINNGNPITFRVIRSGVANLADTPTNWLRDNFLTWQPTVKPVTYYSPEWLTYYATEASRIRLRAHFDNGTDHVQTLGTMAAGTAHTVNVQYALVAGLFGQRYPTHYEVWVETTAGVRLTYTQIYAYSERKSENEQWVLWENSLGGLDTLRAYGDTDFEGEHDHKIAHIDGISSEYAVDTQRTFSQNTGYLNNDERKWLLDFFPSKQKYVHRAAAIRPIIVTESDVKYNASELPSAYNFKYRLADADRALLNLIRNEDAIPDTITIPNIESPDFRLPPRLSEFPRVQISEGVQLPAFEPHTDKPGVVTIGALANAIVEKTMSKIEDGAATGGGQLVQVLGEDSLFAPTNQNVFSSLRTIREITNANSILLTKASNMFLRKDIADIAQEKITFVRGLESKATIKTKKLSVTECAYLNKGFTTGAHGVNETGEARLKHIISEQGIQSSTFFPGILGEGYNIERIPNTQNQFQLTLHKINARILEVDDIVARRWTWVGAGTIWSSAGFVIDKVEEMPTCWRVYPKYPEENDFIRFDQALCQSFRTDGTSAQSKRYWRLVTAVADDRSWIELSKTDRELSSNGTPEAGDSIIQLGHRTNLDRQGAIVLSSFGATGPFFQSLRGINSFDTSGRTQVFIGNRSEFNVDSLKIRSGSGSWHQVPVERGKWIAGISYFFNERVHHNGSIWLCITHAELGTLQEPSETSHVWELQVAKGDAGERGAQGIQGAPGQQGERGVSLPDGLLLNRDPEFREELNGYIVYNNSGGTAVRITRVARPSDAPTTSSHIMRYSFVGGATSPNFGGFVRQTPSRANAVFVHRIIAKIPVGYSLINNQNAVGDNARHEWLTSRAGTSRYEEYIYRLTCGTDGTFHTFGFISFEPRTTENQNTPFDVDVAFAGIYDLTSHNNIADIALSTATTAGLEINTLRGEVNIHASRITTAENNLTGLSTRVSSAETEIRANADAILLRATRTELVAAKSEAILAAAADATTKANNAQTNAIVAARTEATAQFNILADRISSKVERVDFDSLGNRVNQAFTLIEQTPEMISLQVRTIQIGGRNYYHQGIQIRQLITNATIDRNHPDTPYGFFLIGAQPGNSVIRLQNVIKSNGWWTISFDVRGSQGVNYRAFIVDINDKGMTPISITSDNLWVRHSVTVNVENYTANQMNFVDFKSIGWVHIFVRNIQVEFGNKATDFRISPEDENARLLATGINITDRIIELRADRVKFLPRTGTTEKIWINPEDGSLRAVDVNLTGRINADNGRIGDFNLIDGSLNTNTTQFLDPEYLNLSRHGVRFGRYMIRNLPTDYDDTIDITSNGIEIIGRRPFQNIIRGTRINEFGIYRRNENGTWTQVV